MFDRADARRRRVQLAFVCVLASFSCGATASSASAATLKVSVSPKTIHKHTSYHIKIRGSYKKNELKGKAFLVSWMQFTTKRCEVNAYKEYFQYGPPTILHGTISRSPFSIVLNDTGSFVGPRRICVYMYSHVIKASSNEKPLATATTTYKVQK